MMTLILPGYSLKNKDWAYELKNHLKSPDVHVHEWAHWQDNPEMEYKSLPRRQAGLPFREADDIILRLKDESEINIIAKSYGTFVAMILCTKLGPKIKKLVLCGIPLLTLREKNKQLYKKILSNFPLKDLIVFQNSKDPLGSFLDVQKMLHNINPNIKIIEISRADHHYPVSSSSSLLKAVIAAT
jgi:predicted alpha/beta-hydrolase family hydrolase